jgi:hypothetical protein
MFIRNAGWLSTCYTELYHQKIIHFITTGVRTSNPTSLRTLQSQYPAITLAHTDMHALSGIRTHDRSVQAGEDSSCLRPRGHSDRQDKWRCAGITAPFLISSLDGGQWSASRPGLFTSEERAPRYPLDRRQSVPQNRVWTLWRREKYSLLGMEPVACRYTDWAIPKNWKFSFWSTCLISYQAFPFQFHALQ